MDRRLLYLLPPYKLAHSGENRGNLTVLISHCRLLLSFEEKELPFLLWDVCTDCFHCLQSILWPVFKSYIFSFMLQLSFLWTKCFHHLQLILWRVFFYVAIYVASCFSGFALIWVTKTWWDGNMSFFKSRDHCAYFLWMLLYSILLCFHWFVSSCLNDRYSVCYPLQFILTCFNFHKLNLPSDYKCDHQLIGLRMVGSMTIFDYVSLILKTDFQINFEVWIHFFQILKAS